MSAPAAALPETRRRARAAWTCRWRPARTICSSPTKISSTIGVVAKCAPPLRDHGEHAALWGEAARWPRRSHRVGSFAIRALSEEGRETSAHRGAVWPACSRRWPYCSNVGSTAGASGSSISRGLSRPTPRRGSESSQKAAAPGHDADLMLLDTSRSYTLDPRQLLQRHKMSPYLGFAFTGVVMRTIRRGETIFLDGKIVAETRGQFVRPHA